MYFLIKYGHPGNTHILWPPQCRYRERGLTVLTKHYIKQKTKINYENS